MRNFRALDDTAGRIFEEWYSSSQGGEQIRQLTEPTLRALGHAPGEDSAEGRLVGEQIKLGIRMGIMNALLSAGR